MCPETWGMTAWAQGTLINYKVALIFHLVALMLKYALAYA
jgi:hypothetical protein